MTDNGNQLQSTGNPVLDDLLQIMIARFEVLVSKEFLAPQFLSKMLQSPQEVIKFIRQNRAVVADTLEKRLSTAQRPSRSDLERQGIVPRGYFEHGHDIAVKHKHRRKSSATQDLEMMLKLRGQKEDIIKKGIANKEEMEFGDYYELDDTKLDEILKDDADNSYYDDTDVTSVDHDVSIISSLLFKTISEALHKSCIDAQTQEAIVQQEMREMNAEMKTLRNVLDEYLLGNDISVAMLRQNDENMVRDKFHSIQSRLLFISKKQRTIHEKLRILNSVERSMISLQSKYTIRLSQLKKREVVILGELMRQKEMRDRAGKIMYAEKSHKSWALMKLDYTINIAKTKEFENIFDTKEDIEFVTELDSFLSSLRNISEHQKQIVRDYDAEIVNFEGMLMSVRYDMSKLRTMTFKKIYDLHKQVQIAESLELGMRRLSVACATDIERERRHHNIKTMRQLNTLNTFITKKGNAVLERRDFEETIEVQHIMSNSALKCFFCVFLQTMNATIFDIELTFNNLNSELPPLDNNNRVNVACRRMYGIVEILEKIGCVQYRELNEKLTKCVKFLSKLKNAIKCEEKREEKVKTFGINKVILIIARKICIHWKERIIEIEIGKVPKYAEEQTRQLFDEILNGGKIFLTEPKTKFDAAAQILKRVYNIEAVQMNI